MLRPVLNPLVERWRGVGGKVDSWNCRGWFWQLNEVE